MRTGIWLRRFLILSMCACIVPHVRARASAEDAASALAQRLLGERAAEFRFAAIPAESREGAACDVFEYACTDGVATVRGSSGLAMAVGLNWYLKYHCSASVSWTGDQLDLPRPLPDAEPTRKVCRVPWRYCFNYCTFSYTMPWWDWARWQREIDWMALNGINLPLSVTGQESVWRELCRGYGLDQADLDAFLVGPAYLPFGWMGCIDGWGGPLPDSWIDRHRALETQIVERERELGMSPVLQGFTGHAPQALMKRFPDLKMKQLPSWCGFPGTHFVDPEDPRFVEIGKAFVEEQARQFGTNHFYASDTFIEMSPPSSDPAFLAAMGKSIYDAMAVADPAAVWVLQGWIFVNNPGFWKPPQAKAFLGAVADERMLLLDLFCDRDPAWLKTESFYGKPWAWCIVHNFGGTSGLWGDIGQIGGSLADALTNPKRGKLCGAGMMMEGIEQNPIVYDLLLEMPWRDAAPEMGAWVRDFARRRYGGPNPAAEESWELLRQTVYSASSSPTPVFCRRPALALDSGWHDSGVPYDPLRVVEAWARLIDAGDALGNLDTYQYDVANVGRQVLGFLSAPLADEIRAAYASGERERLRAAGERFLALIHDVDRLLRTRRAFLLGKWTGEARRWGDTPEEQAHCEWNARNLITLWGPRDSVLHEYAQKQWSGLLDSFYAARWERFIAGLDGALAAGTLFDDKAFAREITGFEEAWTHGSEAFPSEPEGDTLAVARQLLEKYRPALEAEFAPETPTVSLTTGKPATCSSALPPYPAELACDGLYRDTGKYWATDVSQDPSPWWRVDLGAAMRVGRVVVVCYYGDERAYGFTVETSADGAHWDMAADRREESGPSTRHGYTCRFAARDARYLRVTQTRNSANTGRHLVEVMAFEE